MARSFKLFQILLLVFAWQCCEKACATFEDMTGAANPEASKEFSFRSFASHGIGIPSAYDSSSSNSIAPSLSIDSLSPASAPAGASWVASPNSGTSDKDASYDVGTSMSRNRDGTFNDGPRGQLDYGFKTKWVSNTSWHFLKSEVRILEQKTKYIYIFVKQCVWYVKHKKGQNLIGIKEWFSYQPIYSCGILFVTHLRNYKVFIIFDTSIQVFIQLISWNFCGCSLFYVRERSFIIFSF